MTLILELALKQKSIFSCGDTNEAKMRSDSTVFFIFTLVYKIASRKIDEGEADKSHQWAVNDVRLAQPANLFRWKCCPDRRS